MEDPDKSFDGQTEDNNTALKHNQLMTIGNEGE